jgi:hypothetical protein
VRRHGGQAQSGAQADVVGSHLVHAVLRTMCGSRTGGWSLPCVMSD